MREITLITKTPITSDVVSQQIIDDFPYAKRITVNNENELFLGKFPKEFYIIFDDTLPIESEDSTFDIEEIQSIPFHNGQFNCLFFHRFDVAKAAVISILKKYPELWIDVEGDWMGPADEFLKIY